MSSATRTIEQRVAVTWEFPVTFTHGLFHPENRVLADTLRRLGEERRHRAMVFLDGHVAAARPRLAGEITDYFAAHAAQLELALAPRIVPGGEAIKNDIKLVEGFMQLMLEHHIDRQSFIVIVGGGAVMDAVGLAAALVHRGLRQVRVPTTVLGQNDAGVGVKNGVNYMGGKNAVGTFAPPFAVLNDLDFLVTLPQRDWLCGVAEAWKV
ncbi:MAG: iron-containing alcohol dehydrogenase, partial [Chthoniobacteraceae bacterium]